MTQQRRRARFVALRPLSSRSNRYISLFTAAFVEAGWQVGPLSWRWPAPVQIIHWPNEFFATGRAARTLAWAKLLLIKLSRRLLGARWIWVVHNLRPHDLTPGASLTGPFIRELDGLVFLSAASARIFSSEHRSAAPRLVTRHGDYRTGAMTTPKPWRLRAGPQRMQYFGLIRPYKNLAGLIEAAKPLAADLTLQISGKARKSDLAGLEAARTGHPHILIEARTHVLDEVELEAVVDKSDAVVASYRQVTNSGAAIFALSRNRPVIGPALGSLIELRDEVGPDWVFLYDGSPTAEMLRKALAWVRETPRPPSCPMDNYGWSRVGPEIVRFVEGL